MYALTPLAVTAEPLLRAIAAGEFTSTADLAAKAGRTPKNISRDLTVAEQGGLITREPAIALTPEGQAALAALDRAANPAATPAPADAAANPVRVWTHADLAPNPDQPRKTFDPEEIGNRAASILSEGQLQAILARPHPGAADPDWTGPALQIVDGESRWRAMGLLIEYDKWSADHPVKVDVREMTDEQVETMALIANLQRAELTPLEEAEAFHRQVTQHGRTTEEIAEKVSKTQRFVQLRLSLIELSAADRQLLVTGEIGIKEAQRRAAKEKAKPAPLQLTPAEALVMAEVIAACPDNDGHWATYYRKTECNPLAAAQPGVQAMLERHLISITGPNAIGGDMCGRYQVGVTDYAIFDQFARLYPDLIKPDRAAALLSIRASAVGADAAEQADTDGRMITPWLNGPFALTEEGQTLVEAAAEREREREREEKEQEAEWERRTQSLARARETAFCLIEDFAADPRGGLTEVLEAADSPLPWRYLAPIPGRQACGRVVDANGKAVDFQWGSALDLRLQMIMAAMNTAAGHPPIVVEPEVEDEDADPGAEWEPEDEEQFWVIVGETFQNRFKASEARAAQLVQAAQARLADNDIAYGDDSAEWDRLEAQSVACGYAEDFPDEVEPAAADTDSEEA